MNTVYDYQGININHSYDIKPTTKELSKMHTHEWAEILCFISGSGTYYVEGTPYKLCPGDIIIMRKNEFHCVYINDDVPYERIVISFNEELITDLKDVKDLIEPFYKRPLGKNNRYKADEIFKFNQMNFVHHLFCANELSRASIIANFIFFLNCLFQTFTERKNANSIEENSLSNDIVLYVNDNITSDISLQTICDEFFISKSQLCRLFKKATGASVWDYIITKRLIMAKSFISAGENTTSACYKAGFNDYTAFYRAYKQKYNASPKNDKTAHTSI